jgi:hypothetical protein
MTNRRISQVGERLTDATIQRGRRPAIPPPYALTDRDLRIFAWLEHHRFASTSMLATLFWANRGSAAHERLKLLHDAGFLDKFRPRTVGGGSTEWIYRLTARGWQVLADRWRAALPRLPFGEVNDLSYVGHDLELDATLVEIFDAAYAGSAPLIDRLPLDWHGPELGRIERDGGRPQARPGRAARLPAGQFVATANSLPGVLEPDATLIGKHVASGLPVAVLIEYDRTRRPAKQRDRWRRYDRFLTETWREGRFADHHCAPVVLYVVPATKQIPAFLREADKHLTGWIGSRIGSPGSGTYPGRDGVLFTSRERLLCRDWTVDAVPAHPADVRGTPKVHARTVHAPVPRLFGGRLPAQAAA